MPEARAIYWLSDRLTPILKPVVLGYWPRWCLWLHRAVMTATISSFVLGSLMLLGQGFVQADRVDKIEEKVSSNEKRLNDHREDSNSRLATHAALIVSNQNSITDIRNGLLEHQRMSDSRYQWLLGIVIGTLIANVGVVVGGTAYVVKSQNQMHANLTQVIKQNGH